MSLIELQKAGEICDDLAAGFYHCKLKSVDRRTLSRRKVGRNICVYQFTFTVAKTLSYTKRWTLPINADHRQDDKWKDRPFEDVLRSDVHAALMRHVPHVGREPVVLNLHRVRVDSKKERDLSLWSPHRQCPPLSVYVGRPGKFGNPYPVSKDLSREGAIDKFQAWLRSDMITAQFCKRDIPLLQGWDLVCWCAPQECHASVLLRAANPHLQENNHGN